MEISTWILEPVDLEKWSRKVFKIYKTLKMVEHKLNILVSVPNSNLNHSLSKSNCFYPASAEKLEESLDNVS